MALAAALVAIGLAVQLHGYDLFASAQDRAQAKHVSAAAAAPILDDLDRASDLRPGTQALLAAAALDLRIGRYGAAARVAAHATRREPDNFSAWATLGVAQRAAGHVAVARAAFARARELNPLFVPPR